MNTYIPTPLIVPRIPRNKRIYGTSVYYVAAPVYVAPATAVPTDPEIIGQITFPFEMTTRPEITGYNAQYAAMYGQFPTVRMWIATSETSGYESQQKPLFTLIDNLLDTIYFELSEEQNGFLILQL